MGRLRFPVPPLAGSFRQALTWGAGVALAALVVMAVTMALGLQRAGQLLDRLSVSQNQLAQVTRIEAEVNRLRAETATGDLDAAGATAQAVQGELAAYRRSVIAEAPASASQGAEVDRAALLTQVFGLLRGDLLAPSPSPMRQAPAEDIRRFEALSGQAVFGERQEVDQTIATMRRLRRALTALGAAITVGAALLGGAGVWVMLVRLLRPLRALEAATERAGRGEAPAPIRVGGFAEVRQLADAFSRMDEQIAAQRAALHAANRDLEGQVAQRTQEIEASRQALAEVDRTRRLFFSQIGHELRTPATVIRGEAEVALRDPAAPAPRLREALEHVLANGGFLQRRLEDMLALAQAEDGRITLRREPVDLTVVVHTVIALAEPYVRSSGVALQARLPADAAAMIVGDASWLQQALLALVDNAAKFARGDQVIHFHLQTDPSEALIRVADGGQGVDAADLPFLFESYYQSQLGRTRGGAGLGLSIARWVAEQHGGTIAAENRAGQGLVIEIRLPLQP